MESIWLFLVQGGIIAAILIYGLAKIDKKMDTQEEARIEESIVTFTMLRALGHLSEATAIAQQKGKTNGETEKALDYYVKAKDELNDHLMRRSAERAHVR